MEIIGKLDETIKQLKITSLDISFNELADMYSDDELIINPDYQRTFRWDEEKQSRFIESLLLEMPIPPIYAIEIDDGKYELIDGLQRISSYLSFRGMLKESTVSSINTGEQDEIGDEDDYSYGEESSMHISNSFSLRGCDIIPDLNGCQYEDLPATLKIRIKRSFVRMEVLRKGINPSMKYHMFKRLNTGGEKLSAQEIRNCSIRLIDDKFINFINTLAKDSNFKSTLSYVSKSQLAKKFAEELVLRFFAFKNDPQKFVHDIDDFLTSYMERVSFSDIAQESVFDYTKEEEIFRNTFAWLNQSMGEKAFSVYKGTSSKLTGFNVYQYEAITTGVQSIYKNLENQSYSIDKLRERLEYAKHDDELRQSTIGGGKNSSGVFHSRYNRIVTILGEKNVQRI